ncbi:MAG: hypothetical protein PHR69_06605, partial [Sphaerochaeta sp.]|nr:hypothetical protein [Sphaerochaeta sp.]
RCPILHQTKREKKGNFNQIRRSCSNKYARVAVIMVQKGSGRFPETDVSWNRVDPKNSLILSPTYDKLFDLGLITFKPNSGKIELSSRIAPKD